MIRRQFKEWEYSAVEEYIQTMGKKSELPGIYKIDFAIHDEDCTLYLQPDNNRWVNVLYAQHGEEYITGGSVLASMFELTAYEILKACR